MKDSALKFDRRCHVIYSPACGKSIRRAIALHYPPEERENVWERVQLRYVEFLGKMRTDLGGRKNFHNGRGGTYDCVALTAYYDVCRKVSSIEEIEKMTCALILPAFRRLRFVNCNNPFMKMLMYRAFLNAKKQCDRWGDYKMNLKPFSPDKPIRYEFTECPVAEFAKRRDFPRLCRRSVIRILRLWSLYTQSLFGRLPAQTVQCAIMPYAAIVTATQRLTQNTLTKTATGGMTECF